MSDSPTTHQPSEEPQDRLFDLIIQRATTGLSESEQQELDALASSFNNEKELARFEATAAAFDLSIASTDHELMPAAVHDRLLISAGKFFAGKTSGVSPPSNQVTAAVKNVEFNRNDESRVELSKRRQPSNLIRWREIVAIAVAAASLLLVLSGFNPFAETNDSPPVASVLERMDRLIETNPSDLVDVAWTPVHNKDAGGKVIWSDSKQEGYMVFAGLDANDPSVEQYQLWIFDNDPAQATPTDGGVFDISQSDIGPDGTAVIPIKASVPVDRAVQFAVTVERPGGVYVSKRERIPVLATVETAN